MTRVKECFIAGLLVLMSQIDTQMCDYFGRWVVFILERISDIEASTYLWSENEVIISSREDRC